MTDNEFLQFQPLEKRPDCDRASGGVSMVWSLAKAVQGLTLRLAFNPDTDLDLSMTHAGMDIREALEELEWSQPDIRINAVPVDVGEPPLEAAAVRELIVRLLAAALDAADPLSERTSGSPAEAATPSRVVELLGAARDRATRQLPPER